MVMVVHMYSKTLMQQLISVRTYIQYTYELCGNYLTYRGQFNVRLNVVPWHTYVNNSRWKNIQEP